MNALDGAPDLLLPPMQHCNTPAQDKTLGAECPFFF